MKPASTSRTGIIPEEKTMLFPSRQSPKVRSFRMLPLLLVLAGGGVMAACDGSESPLAPSDEAVPTDVSAPATGAAALTAARIAFTSYSGMLGDIYLMDSQGNNRTRFTTWSNTEFAPSWSYDRKHLAMVRFRTDASNAKHYDIYLMDADGTHKHWAKSYTSTFHIMDPSWSPDGKRLVVTVILQNVTYLATLELATGKLALVSATGEAALEGRDPSYDPTGQYILYVHDSQNTIDMVIPGSWRYGMVTSDTPLNGPTFSPDGTKIAYSRLIPGTGNWEIFVRTPKIGAVKRLTYNDAYDGEPSWSPDGTRIAFTSSRSGRPQIWTMNSSTGGSLVRITNSSKDDMEPAWYH
jgi:Tol biopolymer transport system component